MSKTLIIAAAFSALVIAGPALAQDQGKPAGSGGFGGMNGSATDLRDAPRPGEQARPAKRGTGTRAAPKPRPSKDRPARTQSTNNLKQMGLANR
ncbi:hypothetical protein TPR58_05735 [Sphingomonas sp. HF-S3]|jgi:hypothetical protein|uniref:Uncharacterized protein n=1 Tax=Sphingomonas rustica TaxID=3103142 RepID=A0ABV0B536_9SPHN